MEPSLLIAPNALDLEIFLNLAIEDLLLWDAYVAVSLSDSLLSTWMLSAAIDFAAIIRIERWCRPLQWLIGDLQIHENNLLKKL